MGRPKEEPSRVLHLRLKDSVLREIDKLRAPRGRSQAQQVRELLLQSLSRKEGAKV